LLITRSISSSERRGGSSTWIARQYISASASTSTDSASADSRSSPTVIMPWCASRQALRPSSASTAWRASSSLPNVA